jgi:Conserved region in glutamate synthase
MRSLLPGIAPPPPCNETHGMQGGTAATQTVFIEHVGIPTLASLRQAVDALCQEIFATCSRCAAAAAVSWSGRRAGVRAWARQFFPFT